MAKTVWKLGPEVFGATQQTPILHDGHIFGTRPNGQFVCLGLDGKVVWASPAVDSFGRAPFLLADGLFFVMNEDGKLSLMEDSSTRFNLLAQAQVLTRRRSVGADGAGRGASAGARLHARWSVWTLRRPCNPNKRQNKPRNVNVCAKEGKPVAAGWRKLMEMAE